MAPKHLSTGSSQPPRVEGKLRLYSMEFCPYAERVRMVLLKKEIPHDIVNVDLKRKPEWLHPMNPKELVPVLDTGSEVIAESVDICEYLEQKYPEVLLYPKNEEECKRNKELIRFCDQLIMLYYKATRNPDKLPLSTHLENMEPCLLKLEEELQTRGPFFGGKSTNIVDYMIWPWAERAQVVQFCFNEDLPNEDKYPNIYRWCKEMHKLNEVKETITSPERLYKFTLAYRNSSMDFDSI